MLTVRQARIGRPINCKGFTAILKDEISMKETGNDEKEIVLQLVESDNGDIRIRAGYYMFNENKGWIWARNTPLFWNDDLSTLIGQAKQKGWLI